VIRDPSHDVFRSIRGMFRKGSDAPGDGWVGKAVIAAIVELTLVVMFAVWVGRNYLDFDPRQVPFGREFMMVIQSHNLWEVAKSCGWCALWNGSTSGGYPATAELFGAPLHPIVALTTLIWGVINGTKVALIVSLAVAGLAQWWLGHELQVGWIPRLWSALIAVAGGHLAGRMDDGAFTILLSTAVASLVLPAILRVDRRPSRRSIVLLGFGLASAILAGQGYMQIALITISPALAFLLLDERLHVRETWISYAVSAGLGLLLSGVFLVPLVHFLPNFAKPLDPSFVSAPPLEVLPLNLVIRDTAIYHGTGALGMIGAPAPYTLFIGWVPVLLAVFGFGIARGEQRRRINFLAVGTILILLLASGIVLEWLVKIVPTVAAIRFPSFAAGLMVPMILGIASYGLERLLRMDWPELMLGVQSSMSGGTRGISMRWIILLPLILNVRSDAAYAKAWLTSSQQGDDVPWIEKSLATDELEWVSTPFGEHYFITPAIVSGLKLSPGLKPWGWKDREPPTARIESVRGPAPANGEITLAENFGITLYQRPDEHYAAVMTDSGQEACSAHGIGGVIRVACDATTPGRLIVKENNWTGWKAWIDGERAPLAKGPWLAVDIPASEHTVEFRYLPWDVPLGLILTVLGLVFCGFLWFKTDDEADTAESGVMRRG
jgi:hypothetical protein